MSPIRGLNGVTRRQRAERGPSGSHGWAGGDLVQTPRQRQRQRQGAGSWEASGAEHNPFVDPGRTHFPQFEEIFRDLSGDLEARRLPDEDVDEVSDWLADVSIDTQAQLHALDLDHSFMASSMLMTPVRGGPAQSKYVASPALFRSRLTPIPQRRLVPPATPQDENRNVGNSYEVDDAAEEARCDAFFRQMAERAPDSPDNADLCVALYDPVSGELVCDSPSVLKARRRERLARRDIFSPEQHVSLHEGDEEEGDDEDADEESEAPDTMLRLFRQFSQPQASTPKGSETVSVELPSPLTPVDGVQSSAVMSGGRLHISISFAPSLSPTSDGSQFDSSATHASVMISPPTAGEIPAQQQQQQQRRRPNIPRTPAGPSALHGQFVAATPTNPHQHSMLMPSPIPHAVSTPMREFEAFPALSPIVPFKVQEAPELENNALSENSDSDSDDNMFESPAFPRSRKSRASRSVSPASPTSATRSRRSSRRNLSSPSLSFSDCSAGSHARLHSSESAPELLLGGQSEMDLLPPRNPRLGYSLSVETEVNSSLEYPLSRSPSAHSLSYTEALSPGGSLSVSAPDLRSYNSSSASSSSSSGSMSVTNYWQSRIEARRRRHSVSGYSGKHSRASSISSASSSSSGSGNGSGSLYFQPSPHAHSFQRRGSAYSWRSS